MTLEELSKKILDGEFDEEIDHSDEDPAETESVDEETQPTDEPDSLTHYSVQFTDESDSLEHYGVLGMKWGVRKDRKVRRRDRRYEGESDQEYQNRMQRESAERIAKTQAKQKTQSEKRAARERAQTQKRMLKSQERQQKMQIKAQEKKDEQLRKEQKEQRERQNEEAKKAANKKSKTKTNVGDPVKMMSDQELSDAINRLRREQEYKNLTKKPDGLLMKSVKGVGKVGGGILVSVGKNIVTRQLSDIGNQKADAYLKSKGLKKDGGGNDKSKKNDSSNVTNDELLTRLMLLEENNKR